MQRGYLVQSAYEHKLPVECRIDQQKSNHLKDFIIIAIGVAYPLSEIGNRL